jgi:hypothetical protein
MGYRMSEFSLRLAVAPLDTIADTRLLDCTTGLLLMAGAAVLVIATEQASACRGRRRDD